MDIDSLLDGARRPEKKVTLCLRGDLQAEWEALHEAIGKKMVSSGRKLSDSVDPATADRIRELEAEMREHSLTLTLRALPRRDWLRLVRDHPERPGDAADRELGVNRDTFFDAVVLACIVDPEMTEEQKSRLLDVITDAQYESLSNAAWVLNRKDISVPFSPIASRTTPNTGDTSRRQSDSESRRAGSRGGSQRR